MAIFDEISVLVRDANPDRNASNLHRRTVKLIEELGEVAQAWLNVTSSSNGKHKTWDDVREEIADCLIVALDIGWTVLPSEVEVPVSSFVFPVYHSVLKFEESMLCDAIWYLGKFGRDRVRSHVTRVIQQMQIMALCGFPDQADFSVTRLEIDLLNEIKHKLQKWAANRAKMAIVTDDV